MPQEDGIAQTGASRSFPAMAGAPDEGGSSSSTSSYLSRLLADTVLQIPHAQRNLVSASRLLPSDEDFHFYNNFSEFREPVHALSERAEAVMSQISSLNVLGEASALPDDSEDLYDWLVNLQDDLLEQVDASFDQFKADRAKKGLPAEDDGFMIQDRKKRRKQGREAESAINNSQSSTIVERSDVRFHKWELARPQEKFQDTVDNSNAPFKHPNNAHPLQEKLDSLDFRKLVEVSLHDPEKPKPLSDTPLTFINSASALVKMVSKLSREHEIAVDLEHHKFRSFQGFTCLMQISTRTEDFIIDTLDLRHLIGPLLRNIFSNESIQKVMHGAGKDITWLQRDFGIYVCNLFDTGQAARVLKMEQFGLSYLLQHFCEVAPDKTYQMADWRDRPLSDGMMKYAREDTHYLLYVADKMKQMLVSTGFAVDDENPLIEVYKRSRDVCLKLYEKEVASETSYLQVYGLEQKNFQAENLAVLSGLYAWRDKVSREEDESTGYVLPNGLLLKLAEEMPDNLIQLQSILYKKTPLLIRNLAVIISIIKKSRLEAAKFEDEAAKLRAKAAMLVYEDTELLESIDIKNLRDNEGSSNMVSDGSQNNDLGRNVTQDDEMNFIMVPISENEMEIVEAGKVSESHKDVCASTHIVNAGLSSTLDDEVSLSLLCEKGKETGDDMRSEIPKATNCGQLLEMEIEEAVSKSPSLREARPDGQPSVREINAVVRKSEGSNEVRPEEKLSGIEMRRGYDVASARGATVVVKRSSTSSLFGKQKKVVKTASQPDRSSGHQDEQDKLPEQKKMKGVTVAEESAEELQKQDKMIEGIQTDVSSVMLERTASLNLQAEDSEQVEAKSKVERIKSTFSLPFHDFSGVVDSDELPGQKEKARQEEEDRQAAGTVKVEKNPIEDSTYIELDANESSGNDETEQGIALCADDRHRFWGPDNTLGGLSHESVSTVVEKQVDTLFGSNSGSQLPLSVSQRYRMHGVDSKSKYSDSRASEQEHLTQLSSKKAMADNHVVAVAPFDYGAAKEKLGYLRELDDSNREKRLKQASSKNQTDGSSKAIFDPNRRLDGYKPEGITPGKRRQVFPQTGNRTGFFK